MVKQRHEGQPAVGAETAGGQTAREFKRVSRRFPIPSWPNEMPKNPLVSIF